MAGDEGNRDAESQNKRLRPEKFPLKRFRTGVQLSSPPPNKNRNFDTKRIRVAVLTFLCENAVFAALLARSGLKRKPGQVILPGRVFAFEGLCGPLVALVIVKRV